MRRSIRQDRPELRGVATEARAPNGA